MKMEGIFAVGDRKSLVHAALRHARLAGHEAAEQFWTKPLGSTVRAHRAYLRYSAQVPVNTGIVFYETMSGDRMNDNPYAIFKHLRAHPEYGTYLHVWSLGTHGEIPAEYADLDDVVFVRRGTLSYAYFLACAGHIICNAILPNYLTRRDGQRYLNTWHGIPYKTLGRGAANARFGTASGIGTFLKATHVLTPCEFMTDALRYSYSMTGTSRARVAETGYPRVDLTVNADAEEMASLRQRLGIESREGGPLERPVVLYAPTWRGTDGTDTVDADQLLRDLGALAGLDIQLMYRGHHRIGRLIHDRDIGGRDGRVIVPPQEISSNELLSVVDILITDYSSIFFDFLPTGRPIVHYLYDLEEYARTRGLNLELGELPGAVARDLEQLLEAVSQSALALGAVESDADLRRVPLQGEAYTAARLRFAPHEDGDSSARAVDFFFGDNSQNIPVIEMRDDRPTVAFWAGSLADEEDAEEFLQQAITLATTGAYQCTLVIDRDAYISRDTLTAIKNLRERLSCVAYNTFPPVLLAGEAAKYNQFVGTTRADSNIARQAVSTSEVLYRVFSREYGRRLADARFDRVILAPGLNLHELGVAAFALESGLKLDEPWSSVRALLTPARRAVGVVRPMVRALVIPVRRAVGALLPEGTSRRKRAEKVYRSLRRR